MSEPADTPTEAELRDARATIARQAREIARLRARAAGADRETLALAATAGLIAAPVTRAALLDMIVRTAMRVIGAEASGLLLVDEAHQELVFEVVIGGGGPAIRNKRLPLGHGSVVGLVAASGQPMCTTDTRRDSPIAVELSQRSGYLPRGILCVPMFYREDVIGVLELLDRVGGGTFTLQDQETLGVFANLAAVAIVQSRALEDLARALDGAAAEAGVDPDRESEYAGETGRVDESGALELARLVHEIVRRGTAERETCSRLLSGFRDYLVTRDGRDPAEEPA